MKKTIARMTLLFAVLMAVIIPKSYVLAEEPAAEMESEEVFSQWNPEAPALNALIDYVEAVTDEASPDYIPEEDRKTALSVLAVLQKSTFSALKNETAQQLARAKEAMQAVKAYKGNCGIWFSNGIYYIDNSKRVNTKREAMTIGKACKQISVLCWRNMKLAYC